MSTNIEKTWHASKKFLAFLVMEIILGGFLFYTIFATKTVDWPTASILTVAMLNMGFIAVAFNAKQAELDRYLRLAALTKGTKEE